MSLWIFFLCVSRPTLKAVFHLIETLRNHHQNRMNVLYRHKTLTEARFTHFDAISFDVKCWVKYTYLITNCCQCIVRLILKFSNPDKFFFPSYLRPNEMLSPSVQQCHEACAWLLVSIGAIAAASKLLVFRDSIDVSYVTFVSAEANIKSLQLKLKQNRRDLCKKYVSPQITYSK